MPMGRVTWTALVKPIAQKFTVAEKFGKETVFNHRGGNAVRDLLIRMATTLDEWATKHSATHHSIPRRLPDGPIKIYPVEIEDEVARTRYMAAGPLILNQALWSIILDQVLRAEARKHAASDPSSK